MSDPEGVKNKLIYEQASIKRFEMKIKESELTHCIDHARIWKERKQTLSSNIGRFKIKLKHRLKQKQKLAWKK